MKAFKFDLVGDLKVERGSEWRRRTFAIEGDFTSWDIFGEIRKKAGGDLYGAFNFEPMILIIIPIRGLHRLWVTLAGDILEQAWGALGAETPQQQVECVAGGDLSPVPDGYIGYNGALVYFDQMRSEFPALYKVLDPRSYAGRNTNVPLLFIFGDQDFSYANLPWFKKGVYELSAMLEAAGNDLQFELWPGIGHNVDTRSVPLFTTAFEILP